MGESKRRKSVDPNYGKPTKEKPITKSNPLSLVEIEKQKILNFLIRETGGVPKAKLQALANINDNNHCVVTLLEFAQICYKKHGNGVVIFSSRTGIDGTRFFYKIFNNSDSEIAMAMDLLAGDRTQKFLLGKHLGGDFCTTELISTESKEARWKCLLPISWQESPNIYLLANTTHPVVVSVPSPASKIADKSKPSLVLTRGF